MKQTCKEDGVEQLLSGHWYKMQLQTQLRVYLQPAQFDPKIQITSWKQEFAEWGASFRIQRTPQCARLKTNRHFAESNMHTLHIRIWGTTGIQSHYNRRHTVLFSFLNNLIHYAFQARTALFWTIKQRVLVITYRRFGTNNRPHLH